MSRELVWPDDGRDQPRHGSIRLQGLGELLEAAASQSYRLAARGESPPALGRRCIRASVALVGLLDSLPKLLCRRNILCFQNAARFSHSARWRKTATLIFSREAFRSHVLGLAS